MALAGFFVFNNGNKHMIRPTLIIAAMLAASTATAAEPGARFGVGVDYSSGDYGSDISTEILSIPVSAHVETGNWRFRASLPWVRVSGDPNVLPTLGVVDNFNPVGRGRSGIIGAPPDQQAPTESGTASGIGDLTLGATYSLSTGTALGVDVGAHAKVATADEDKGLGTGANDYGVTLDVYRDFDGTMVFGGIGHTRLGTSEFIDVDSVNTGNIGVSQLAGRGRIGVMYEHRSASASGLDARRDVVGFFNMPAMGTGKLQLYASRGLSDSSPDWGVGIAITSGN